jgi:hypothetical protein
MSRMKKIISTTNYLSAAVIIGSAMNLAGCGPNESILRSNSNAATDQPVTNSGKGMTSDSAEAEVENMRTADFEFILVLRRKDGGVMQSDDKAVVRTTTPGSNRRSLVDGDKAIVIGSNARIPPEVFKKLTDHFAVQDFSKSDAENTVSNTPANANIEH